MKLLFYYNWQVRDEWFQVFESLSQEELLRERTGGLGSILKTLHHIIDVEYSWIRAINNKPDIPIFFEQYSDLKLLKSLSDELKIEIRDFVERWSSEMEYKSITPPWMNQTFYKGEVLRHVIAHEIHHIGQLSIWARDIGLDVVSSNFIERDLMGKS